MITKHTILSPYKGLNLAIDPTLIDEHESPELRNVEFWNGMLRCARNFIRYSVNYGSGNPRALVLLDNEHGQNVIFITSSNIYKSPLGSTLSLSLVSSYSGADSWRHVSTYISMGKLLFTDGINYPMKYDGLNAPTVLGNLQSLDIKARFINSFYSHYILGYTIESGYSCPQRLRWSNIGSMDDWSSGTAGFIDLVDTPDTITGLVSLQNKLVVFKENSIWDVSYVGYPQMFIATPTIIGVGCISPDSISVGRDVIYFVGIDGIYTYDGSSVTKISGKIDSLFAYNQIDKGKLRRAAGVYINVLNEYWVSLPVIRSGGTNDTFYRYNTITGGWYPWIYSIEGSPSVGDFGGFMQALKARDVTTWNGLSGKTWTSLVGKSWGSLSSGSPELIVCVGYQVFGGSPYIYRFSMDDGTNDWWWFVTKDFTVEDGNNFRVTKIKFEYIGEISLVLKYSVDGGITWYDVVPWEYISSTDWAWYSVGMNVTCNKIRFKFIDQNWDSANKAIRKIIVEYAIRRPYE